MNMDGRSSKFSENIKGRKVDFGFQRMHWDVKPTVAVVIV